MRTGRNFDGERAKSAVAAGALQLLIGYAFVTGLGFDLAPRGGEGLKLFDIAAPPPPPAVEEPPPPRTSSRKPEGAASPANLVAKPTPVVAPLPVVPLLLPPPVIAAPVAGTGADPSAGASDVPGPGTGAGGEGVGTGSGGRGSGSGGGGAAVRARLLKGRIVNSDYPEAASRAGAIGTVIARFTVRPDGRASQCRVTRSSGNADLDATTCRLIEKRFRYAPARDAAGEAMPDVMGWKQEWWLERR